MNIVEFSNQFDIEYNNVMSNAAPPINEYEKSVFLTKAQLELLKNYFNPKGNKYQEGFDDSSPRQFDFSNLMKVVKPRQILAISEEEAEEKSPRNDERLFLYLNEDYDPFDERSYIYKAPNDILAIVNEKCFTTIDGRTYRANIVPISYDEYTRLIQKPYGQPLKRQVWRLMNSYNYFDDKTNDSVTDVVYELIGKDGCEISDYTIRYVRKPRPIILCNLHDNYPSCTIEGEYLSMECELDSAIHPEIVQRAVELAKAAYVSGDTETAVQMGVRSE